MSLFNDGLSVYRRPGISSTSSGYGSFNDNGSEVSVSNSGHDHQCLLEDSGHESEWEEDEWPSNRALPLPEWGTGRPDLVFDDVIQFQSFVDLIEIHLAEVVSSFSYDTVSNFLLFSSEYLAHKSEYSSIGEFYRDYDPPVLPGCYTCVGLCQQLLGRLSTLEGEFLGLKDAMYLVSAEEKIENIEDYCNEKSPPLLTCEKEHVLVCIRFRIGTRSGVVLLEPGYHMTKSIIVTADSKYPHTGSFHKTGGLSDISYNYSFSSSNSTFVVWERVKANGEKSFSLVHVARPFLSALDISERRNIIYPFKSLLFRDKNGALTFGLYFPVKELDATNVTFFYTDNDQNKHKMKIPLRYFLTNSSKADPSSASEEGKYEEFLKHISSTILISRVRPMLAQVSALSNCSEFVDEIHGLNGNIDDISKDN